MNVKQHNTAKQPHLSAAEIEELLHSDHADPNTVAVAHLETCGECQSRMTQFAAKADEWSEVQNHLSGSSVERWTPDTTDIGLALTGPQVEHSAANDLVLRLLGKPNHPEMLGRLGRYDIERVIGAGGMGVVLKAHDSELNRPIAIKILAPHLAHVGAARERFAREGRAAAAVVHEHVVAIYNVESGESLPFLVMQYVPGRSLEARVSEDGPLGVEEILRIGVQASAGLAAAHRQGLVHRDVKPANILLENSVERAILTDFGLARAIDDASLTQTGILAGTPHYMSPEQAMGGAIDHRSDLFSLGAVLYFMATGHPPFRGSNALGVLHRICREAHRPTWQVNKEIPDELCDVIDALLEKKPARRLASAEDVQQRLSALLSRIQQEGLGRRRWRGWRSVRLRRAVAGAAVVALLATVAIVGQTWWPETAARAPAGGSVTRQESGSGLRSDDAEFFGGVASTQQDLDALIRPAQFMMSGHDSWQHEIDSIERNLEVLESVEINSNKWSK